MSVLCLRFVKNDGCYLKPNLLQWQFEVSGDGPEAPEQVVAVDGRLELVFPDIMEPRVVFGEREQLINVIQSPVLTYLLDMPFLCLLTGQVSVLLWVLLLTGAGSVHNDSIPSIKALGSRFTLDWLLSATHPLAVTRTKKTQDGIPKAHAKCLRLKFAVLLVSDSTVMNLWESALTRKRVIVFVEAVVKHSNVCQMWGNDAHPRLSECGGCIMVHCDEWHHQDMQNGLRG